MGVQTPHNTFKYGKDTRKILCPWSAHTDTRAHNKLSTHVWSTHIQTTTQSRHTRTVSAQSAQQTFTQYSDSVGTHIHSTHTFTPIQSTRTRDRYRQLPKCCCALDSTNHNSTASYRLHRQVPLPGSTHTHTLSLPIALGNAVTDCTAKSTREYDVFHCTGITGAHPTHKKQ